MDCVKPHKISAHSEIFIHIFSIGYLIELKFCEASRNSFSNRALKFQLSILKKQKDKILKKYEISQESTGFNIKTTSFVYCPNFQQRFWFDGQVILNLCLADIEQIFRLYISSWSADKQLMLSWCLADFQLTFWVPFSIILSNIDQLVFSYTWLINSWCSAVNP